MSQRLGGGSLRLPAKDHRRCREVSPISPETARESITAEHPMGSGIPCLPAKTSRAGLKLKTARTAARRDFIAAHPRPKDVDELMRADEFPGLSVPSIRQYHKAYIKFLST